MYFNRIWITISLLIFSLNIASSADLVKNSDKSKDRNIFLQSSAKPSALDKPNIIEKTISNISNSTTSEKSKWLFSVNDKTNINTQAYGKPLKINGYPILDSANIEKAALDFLLQNKSSLNIDAETLKFSKAKYINNRWYVSFSQYYKGLKVLLSDVELRIFKNGNVFAISSDYYKYINLNLTPKITLENARIYAIKDLDFVEGKDKLEESKDLFILPVKNDNSITYKLVYSFDIELNSQNQSYFVYVDANSGNIVWRQNKVHSASTELKVEGNIRTKHSFSPENKVLMNNQNFIIGNSNYTTDNEGKININIDKPTAFQTTFSGPFCVVLNEDKPNEIINDTLFPNQNKNFLWSDENSIKQQRNIFYYVNFIHNYFKILDPDLTVMDFPMKITIRYGGDYVNAASSGKYMYYWGVDKQGYFFGETPEILYHEYGHSINDLLYKSLGKEKGMINSACHEGLADVTAAMIIDESKVGIGAFSDSTEIIRNLDNNMKYPDDIDNESHNDGQILSGAFWDLRKAVSLDYVRHISHFVRYATPDDPETRIAFSKWLFEVIVADDDDGDLTNGTPHLKEIIESFEKHGIDGYLYSYFTFSHNPPMVIEDASKPCIINFSIKSLPFMYALDSVALNYYIDGYNNMKHVFAVKDSEDNYKAAIPIQPRGTIARYYFSAFDKKKNISIEYAKTNTETYLQPYTLLIGYKQAYFEDFEIDRGWKTGAEGDDAIHGKWERNIPNAAILQFKTSQNDTVDIPIQCAEDHTENGKYCLITDATGGKSTDMINYLPQGTTSIISPAYDISKLKNPVISYYLWFYNMPVTQQYGADCKALISFDDGVTWKYADYNNSNSIWSRNIISIKDIGSPTKKMRIMYKIENKMSDIYPYPAAFAEALVDDMEILTGNDEIISSIEENNDIIAENDIKVYPNPIRDFANISYKVKFEGHVIIKLINSIGETVSILLDENKPAGTYNLEWNLLNYSKMKILPGLYFLQFNSQSETKTVKMIIY